MHQIQFRQIMRDAEVAYAIYPIVRRHLLTVEETADVLRTCGMGRPGNVAWIAMGQIAAARSPIE